jgi:hypothetical protein
MFPNLVEHAFIQQKRIRTMNQQTSYLHKTKCVEYKKHKPTSKHEGSVFHVNEFKCTPDLMELTRIMLGTVSSENAKNMTLQERHAFYDIASDLISLTQVRK